MPSTYRRSNSFDVLVALEVVRLRLFEQHLPAGPVGAVGNAAEQFAEVGVGKGVPQGGEQHRQAVGVLAGKRLREPVRLVAERFHHPPDPLLGRPADARVVVEHHADRGDGRPPPPSPRPAATPDRVGRAGGPAPAPRSPRASAGWTTSRPLGRFLSSLVEQLVNQPVEPARSVRSPVRGPTLVEPV